MKIELYIRKDIDYQVELDDKTNIILTKELRSIKDLSLNKTSLSYNINIPTTNINNSIFSFQNDIDVISKFKNSYDCILYVDEIIIFQGKLLVNEIDNNYYKCNLYEPNKKELNDFFGDKTMNNILPFPPLVTGGVKQGRMAMMNTLYDYALINKAIFDPFAPIINTCNDNSPADVSQENALPLIPFDIDKYYMIFPYMIYGTTKNKTEYGDFDTQYMSIDKTGLTAENLFPAFNVLGIIKDCFADAGFTVKGNIFNDEKFQLLYQSYSQSDDTLFNQVRFSPQVLKLKGSYKLRINGNNGNTSLLAQDFGISQFDDMKSVTVAKDNLILVGEESEKTKNKVISFKDDKYKMITTNENNQDVITINKSGWYKVRMQATLTYPNTGNNRWTQTGRIDVTGTNSSADRSDLFNSPFELQLLRGLPLQDARYYSINGFLPSTGKIFNNQNTGSYIKPKMNIGWYSVNTTYLMLNYQDGNEFSANGDSMGIRNTSLGYNDLITCIRWGYADFNTSLTYQHGTKENNSLICLNKPRFTYTNVSNYDSDNNDRIYFPINRVTNNDRGCGLCGDRYVRNCDNNYSNTVGYSLEQAEVVHGAGSLYNYNNHYIFKIPDNIGTTKQCQWVNSPQPATNKISGLNTSSARVLNQNVATGESYSLCWLEKGESVQLECVIPQLKKADKANCCSGGDDWKSVSTGFVNTNLDWELDLTLVTSDKEYNFIKNGIPSQQDLEEVKPTNISALLPDNITVADYVNNFIKTFNLTLSSEGNNVFNIDYIPKQETQINKVIDFSNKVHRQEASFKRIDFPGGFSFEFDYDKNEYGYNNPEIIFELPGDNVTMYNGRYEIVNDLSIDGKITNQKSLWSYCWYKETGFGGYNGVTRMYPVPIIANNSIYAKSYESARLEKLPIKSKPRLFYLTTLSIQKNISDYKPALSYISLEFNFNNNVLDFPVLIPKAFFYRDKSSNNIISPDASKNINSLTYDAKLLRAYNQLGIINSNNVYTFINPNDLIDNFFDINIESSYQLTLPVYLSNKEYSDINTSSLISFNNSTYKPLSIQGHNINGKQKAKLNLLSNG